MEIRRYWFIIGRQLWLIVAAAAIGGAIALASALTTTPLYSASAKVLVNPPSDPSGSTSGTSTIGSDLTYTQLMTTRPLLQETIQDLHLAMSPETLITLVNVQIIRSTRLLQISVTNSNPVLARDIANALANKFIQEYAAQQLGPLTVSQDALKQQLLDVSAQMRTTANTLAPIAGSQSIQAAQLQFNLTQQQTTYWGLQHSLTDLQLAEAHIVASASVVEPAITPTTPFAPAIRQGTVTGVSLGLLVGLAIAFLIDYLDDTVKNQDDVREASGLTPLGAVLRLRRGGGNVLLVEGFPAHSQFAEGYRMLRANVDFARVELPGNVFLVTSAGQGEGKSTTLVNLAVALAESGRTVLAIDADLRRPFLHKAFGLENDFGLTSLLLEDSPQVSKAIQTTSLSRLFVVTSGPMPPNSGELLGSARMRRLIEKLRGLADVVLMDSPPVLAVSDPTVLAPIVDGVLLVVAASQTRKDELTRARQVLAQGTVHLLGVILNKVGNRQGGYYYYYRSGGYAADVAAPNGASASNDAEVGAANGHVAGGKNGSRGLNRLARTVNRVLLRRD